MALSHHLLGLMPFKYNNHTQHTSTSRIWRRWQKTNNITSPRPRPLCVQGAGTGSTSGARMYCILYMAYNGTMIGSGRGCGHFKKLSIILLQRLRDSRNKKEES